MTVRGMFGGLMCSLLVVRGLDAQSVRDTTAVPISPAVMQRVQAARAHLEQGDGAEARGILDSLVRATPAGTLERAEALYWRAALAERASEAERDWRRVVVEIPLSPRTPDILLRLGDLEMLRQRPAQARTYFERVVREFPGTPQRVRAALWLARSYVEQRELVSGCRAFAALNRAEIPVGELQLQADELRRQCAAVPSDSVAPPPSASTATMKPAPPTTPSAPKTTSSSPVVSSAAGRYAVQVGAYETVQEAREMVARMKTRGFEARIDGEQRPFRVRIGRFAARREAVLLLAKVKATGVDAFVAELPQ